MFDVSKWSSNVRTTIFMGRRVDATQQHPSIDTYTFPSQISGTSYGTKMRLLDWFTEAWFIRFTMRQQVVLQFNACCDGALVLIFDILNWTTDSRHSPRHTMHFRLATGLWPFYMALSQSCTRTKHFPIPYSRVPYNIQGFDMKVFVSRCTIIPQP